MRELHEDCNAQVDLKIASDESKTHCYDSNPEVYRNVSIQVGAPTCPSKNVQRELLLVHIHLKKFKKDVPKMKGVTPLNVKSIPEPSGSKKKPKVTKQKV